MAVQYYTVKSGDTLSKIANANKTTVAKLMELNKDTIANKNFIRVGQIIRLPGSVTITEKPVTAPTKGEKNYSQLGEAVEKCVQKIVTLPEFKTLEGLIYGDED